MQTNTHVVKDGQLNGHREIGHRFHESNDISPRRLQDRRCQPGSVRAPAWGAPRFDKVAGSAGNGQQNEDGGCAYIRPPQEGVLAAYP